MDRIQRSWTRDLLHAQVCCANSDEIQKAISYVSDLEKDRIVHIGRIWYCECKVNIALVHDYGLNALNTERKAINN